MKPRRILAVDLGTKRVGLAISDPMGMFAQPDGYLPYKNRETLADELKQIAAEKSVDLILVGLPTRDDGTHGKAAENCKVIAETIRARCGVELKFWDERYTTQEAENILIGEMDMSRSKRKKNIDSMAACMILRSYMDSAEYKRG